MINDELIQGVYMILAQAIRVGVVTSTDPDAGTARVIFHDADGMESYDLKVLHPKTHRDKFYFMPDPGEQVLCLCLPFGHEQGFILGAFYSQADKTPVQSQDKRHVLFDDGTFWEYDRKTHHGVLDMREPGGVLEIFTGTTHIRITPEAIWLRADDIYENDDR